MENKTYLIWRLRKRGDQALISISTILKFSALKYLDFYLLRDGFIFIPLWSMVVIFSTSFVAGFSVVFLCFSGLWSNIVLALVIFHNSVGYFLYFRGYWSFSIIQSIVFCTLEVIGLFPQFREVAILMILMIFTY